MNWKFEDSKQLRRWSISAKDYYASFSFLLQEFKINDVQQLLHFLLFLDDNLSNLFLELVYKKEETNDGSLKEKPSTLSNYS